LSSPAISIIAVSYFGSSDAEFLVDSVLTQDFDGWRLFIVDNSGSDDEQQRLLRMSSRDPRIEIVSPGMNLGYFGAAQFALDLMEATEDVVVMNTDIVFGNSRVLGQLRKESIGRQGLGVLAPAIISNRTNSDQNPHLASVPSVRAATKRRWATSTPLLAQIALVVSDLKRRRKTKARREPSEPTSIYAAHGAFIYLTRRYFDSAGDLHHPLFLFGEEIYVAEHARQVGLETVHFPNIEMKHVEHGTMGMRRSRAILRMSGEATKYALRAARAARQERLTSYSTNGSGPMGGLKDD